MHETIPVQSRHPLVLLYPKWETGSHAPTASVAALAGLQVHAGGHALTWHRDPVDVFAFHVDVPHGAASVDVDFQFLSPLSARAGAVTMTQDIVTVPWASVLVYPAGWFARDIPVAAAARLPPGLQSATALEPAASDARDEAAPDTLYFATTSLERLADSPVYAGRYFRREELAPAGQPPVRLDVFAEAPESLDFGDAQLAGLRRMVEQTVRLFGTRHFKHYDFLLTLGDAFPGPGGIEHLDSSENTLPADYLKHPDADLVNADLLAHEFVHAWNGRYRQPADLWTANLNEPMQDSLLWVYEGQTQFWGRVLGARSGLRTLQETRDQFAIDAAETQARAGRAWKSLQESSSDSLYMAGHSSSWRDWTRREDYYIEGPLLWLDIDARLRAMTNGKKGLDDFASVFFGGREGDTVARTYTFGQLCDALGRTAPADWRAILRHPLDSHDGDDLLRGLQNSGWRLAWTDTPTPAFEQAELDAGGADLSYSIGAVVDAKGALRSVRWNGSAFRAGLNPGLRIVSVNGRPFGIDILKTAIQGSATVPLDLLVAAPGGDQAHRLDYRGPLRYPRLERVVGVPDRLDALLAPAATRPAFEH